MADYKYTPESFKSDQQVKWCAGCGDHAVLNAVQRALPEVADALDKPHEKFVFVSGIGCSSRFINELSAGDRSVGRSYKFLDFLISSATSSCNLFFGSKY